MFPSAFRLGRKLAVPCYTAQTLSTQIIFIYDLQFNIMPLSNFYDFLGCEVPSITSCNIKDDGIPPIYHPSGIILD